jgi:hypothetical protein
MNTLRCPDLQQQQQGHSLFLSLMMFIAQSGTFVVPLCFILQTQSRTRSDHSCVRCYEYSCASSDCSEACCSGCVQRYVLQGVLYCSDTLFILRQYTAMPQQLMHVSVSRCQDAGTAAYVHRNGRALLECACYDILVRAC